MALDSGSFVQASPVGHQILNFGNAETLLLTRELILIHAGFGVVSLNSKRAIGSIPLNQPIDLAILGHSLNKSECINIIQEVRLRWPEAKILVLTTEDSGTVEFRSGVYLMSSRDPAFLLAVCDQLLTTVNL